MNKKDIKSTIFYYTGKVFLIKNITKLKENRK